MGVVFVSIDFMSFTYIFIFFFIQADYSRCTYFVGLLVVVVARTQHKIDEMVQT